ncbi:hypothetical protein AXE80_03135 [Wenyingzhuangia fucanilytica]|uniref:Secretion system C-terminal sorting domain-containing protein n=1 Tax=Wenyingzhuangia fucanilytica TaxID=1790137 RepID=A0A1B1Y3K2_9FLAO|nr:hypothetical protein [Wenyingzhuangia fucanilytica]ANW95343.1 hypothetical protein AXE80_03135 [Wenyingzhuangia fucanilytica]
MKKSVAMAALFINIFVVSAQDLGPGGVGSTEAISDDYMLWMSAEKEVVETSGGLVITSKKTTWGDLSGNGNSYEGVGVSILFIGNVSPPKLINSVVNQLPTLEFSNSYQYLEDTSISGQLDDDSHTIIMVWKSDETNPSNGKNVIASENLFSLNTNNNQFRLSAKDGGSTTNYTFGSVSDYTSPTISFISRTSDDKLKVYKNGVLVSTQNISNTNHFNWTTNSSITLGLDISGDKGDALESNMFEIIHTSVDFDNEIVNKILIENYLSAKYNIALGQNDVYKGDDNGYDYQVAGIGQDTNANANSSAKGTGVVAISNPSDLDNDEYLIWGQNTIEDYSFEAITEGKRLSNIWSVSSRAPNGSSVVDVGTVTVSVDLSDLDEEADNGSQKFRMLVSSSEDLTNSTEYIATISNGAATFSEVVLSDTDYFTFEYSIDKVTSFNGSVWSSKTPDNTTTYYDVIIESGTVNLGTGEFKMKSLVLQNSSNLIFEENATVIIDEEITLNSSAALYLEDGAQLIQNNTGTNTNTGTNFYIPFTTPVKDSYSFSYISSPVSNNNSTYSFADHFKDGRVGSDIVNNETSFVYYNNDSDGAQTGAITALSTHWMYTYFNSENWVLKRSTGAVPIGQGLTIKEPGTTAQRYYAKGTPNNGDYSLEVDENTISLLGNPYPSALDADRFLSDNSIISTLYFYEDKAGVESHYQSDYDAGYGVYTEFGGGIAASVTVNGISFLGEAPEKYIPVGQGFMADATADGTIEFKNSQRAIVSLGSTSKFFKQQKSSKLINSKSSKTVSALENNLLPSLRIGFQFPLANGKEYHRQLGVNFKSGNSIETFDTGYDAILFDEKPTDAYIINKTEEKFVMAGVSQITEETEVPIYVVVDQTKEVSFMIDKIENLNKEVYLYDKELEIKESLNDGDIVRKNLSAGTYSDRFSLVFKEDASLAVSNIDKGKLEIIIHKNQLIVASEAYSINALSLINIKGSTVSTSNNNMLNYTNSLTGIFVLKIKTDQGIAVKKIFL